VELFSMEAELDPKFLNKFSTDYRFEELTPEQQEVHNMLFEENEAILVGEEGLTDEKVELDDIIGQAKGGEIKLKALSKEDEEKKRKLEEKERQTLESLNNQKILEKKSQASQRTASVKETEMSEDKFEETQNEKFIRQIIGKPPKKVKFEEIDEHKSEDEMSDGEDDRSDEDFLPPKEMPKKAEFSADDFPHVSIYNDLPVDDDAEFPEMDDDGDPDEDDGAMETAIIKEQELENQFKEVLRAEYGNQPTAERVKEISTKEFDSIINSHLNSMDPTKKKALASKAKPEKKPEVVSVAAKGGGQITFYFGGAKPDEGKTKAKKTLAQGIKAAVGPEKHMAELKALMAAQAAKSGQVVVQNTDEGAEEWEEEDLGEEECSDDGEEEEDSDDENLDPEEKYEKMLEKMQLLEKLPLCMRIERDAKLPDTIMGLKVFKKTLAPDMHYKDDHAAQRVAEEEEEIDFSKPPQDITGPSIRGALVESRMEPKVATKVEALGNATVVREKNLKKKKHYKKKHFKSKEAPAEEAKETDDQDESESKEALLVRTRNETEEEKKARKALVKQLKDERKEKKQKFKEKYEQMKKGFLTQTRAQTDGTQGVPVYRIT
jgi:hypothetical protein